MIVQENKTRGGKFPRAAVMRAVQRQTRAAQKRATSGADIIAKLGIRLPGQTKLSKALRRKTR